MRHPEQKGICWTGRIARTVAAVCIVGAVSLAAAACRSPFGADSQPGLTRGALVVLPGLPARSVVADFSSQIEYWELDVLDGEGVGDVSPIASAKSANAELVVLQLAVGRYTLEVRGYNDNDTPVLSGSESVDVKADEPTLVTVNVAPYQDAGTGSLRLELRFPATIGITRIRAAIAGSSEEDLIITTNGSTATAVVAVSELSAGMHELMLSFYAENENGDEVPSAFINESVNIWRNVESNRWLDSEGNLSEYRQFSVDDFFSRETALDSLDFEKGELQRDGEAIDFDPDVLEYELHLSDGEQVSFVALAKIEGQLLEYRVPNDPEEELVAGKFLTLIPGETIELSEDPEVLQLRVTAPDRTSVRIYTVDIRIDTNDANDDGEEQ